VLRRPSALAWINRASGSVLVALGLRLAAAERG
jgi:threonine/homoserine/homoserine lactone efflux protein